MKSWMFPWLLPVGMLGAVVFVSIFDSYSALVALPVALGGAGSLAHPLPGQ